MADRNFKVKNGLTIGENIAIDDDGTITGLDTDDLDEGSTNVYYTDARVDTNFATKTTDDLAEGTNLYYTDGRVDTNFATKDTDDLAEGSTNVYYTDGRVDTNFATKTTDDLAEGTNLYYTDGRARSAVTDDVELALDGTTVYVKSMRDATRVRGSLEMTRDNSYVFPPVTNNWTVGNNGFDIASSNDGWIPGASTSLFQRDTFAYSTSGTGFAMRTADGTSATTGINPWFGTPNTGPLQTTSGSLLGTINWNAYATGTPGSDWTNNFSTNSMGGGVRVNHSLQLQGYTTEAPTTTTVSVTPVGTITRFASTVTGTSILTTTGVFSYTGTVPGVGQVIRISGTPSGTGSIVGYTSGKQYYCVARDTTALTFTISETPNGLPVTTQVGTTTGMTIQRCGVTLPHASLDPIPFYNAAIVHVTGVTNITDGYYTVFSSTATTTGIGYYSVGATPVVTGASRIEADTVIGGAGLRVRAFPTGTIWNLNTRVDMIDHTLSGATYRADSFTFQNKSSVNLTGNNLVYNRVYGQWQYNTTVTPAAADTAYVFPLGVVDINNIATVGSTSRLIPGAAGVYNLQFSVQIDNSSNSDHKAYIWLRKNGVDVPGSMGQRDVGKNTAGGLAIIAWNYIVDSANTTDYWEIAYAVSNTSVFFPFIAATAFGPSTASIITSLTPVGA